MANDHEQEFTAYVTARQEALRRSAYLLCRDFDQADDLVQATVTKLFVGWRTVRDADNIDAYAHTVLVRAFLDEHRRGWWRVRLPGRSPERATPVVDTATRLTVRDALGRLAPRQRAVLLLRFYRDLDVEQTAAALGCSAGTVKSQTHRALAALRALLGDPDAPTLTEPAGSPATGRS